MNVPDENPLMMHCSCVQIAVRALNVSWPVRVTRKLSDPPWTRAALPTAASGEPLSTVKVIVFPALFALIVANGGTFMPPPGAVGLPLPPPQPSTSDATVTSEIA
jgi:hypothetical protein